MKVRFLIFLGPLIGVLTPSVAAPPSGTQKFSDEARPGLTHHITVKDLPADFATPSASNGPKVVPPPEGAMPAVLPGFTVTLFAKGLNNPRKIITAPNGDIFVAESGPGCVLVLRDSNNDGVADMKEVFAFGLHQPFGLAFYPSGPNPQYLYVGNTDGVVRFPYKNGDLRTTGTAEPIAPLSSGGRLTGGGHWTRDVAFSLDDQTLYASIGSKSNLDEKNDPIENDRARILQFRPDGSARQVYAWGIRNPVCLAINPTTGRLWTTCNERDGLGDDLVPDYFTAVKSGGFYGWPWYYLGNHLDPRKKGNQPNLGAMVVVPDVLFQAHSAALGCTFYQAEMFPKDYRGDAFVALHGSWNRSLRTGYKIVRIPFENGIAKGSYEDFVTGFVLPDGNVWGRPVGVTVAKDGALLFSEDGNNSIWRVSCQGGSQTRKPTP